MPHDNHQERWRFSLRQLLIITTAVACTLAATVALPTAYGSISLLVATLVLPGALGTIAALGGPQVKTFCLSALVPIIFCLYAVGWALGWVVFQSSAPLQLMAWFNDYGNGLKSVILSAWICGAVAGLFCVVIRRMLQP
jgi:hypothetical protein